jgi:hypothetical protein
MEKIILFGAGLVGQAALRFYGIKDVAFFADNNKCGTYVNGIRVITFENMREIHKYYKVIVSVGRELNDEVVQELSEAGIPFTLYSNERYKYKQATFNPFIRKFKDAYKGRKCFLIGNGPSLSVDDLERVQSKGYVTMACNLINKLYDKTDWRADFYFAGEPSILEINKDFILNTKCNAIFLRDLSEIQYYDGLNETVFPSDIYFFCIGFNESFSEDVSVMCNSAWSIMYPMIEFAVYMGFCEIYLIGVDNTQLSTVHSDDFLKVRTHFYEESVGELAIRREIIPESSKYSEEVLYEQRLNRHYQIAREYTETHGIKILNATRGGKLEVFDRVDIDSLLSE